MNINIALRRFLHSHGNIAIEGSPKPGLCSTLIFQRTCVQPWCPSGPDTMLTAVVEAQRLATLCATKKRYLMY